MPSNTPGPGDCTLALDGSTSSTSPSSTTVSSYLWTIPAGAVFTGGDTSATPNPGVDFTLVAGIVLGANVVNVDLQVTNNWGDIDSTGSTPITVTCP